MLRDKKIYFLIITITVGLMLSACGTEQSDSSTNNEVAETNNEENDVVNEENNDEPAVNTETKANSNSNSNENADKIKQQSKEVATNFVKEFHSLDETLDNPTQHIENAQEYMEDDFYEFLLNDYPISIDGTDKQTWDKVSAKEFGKFEDDRIWDVNVKGELKNDDGKEDLDIYYVVKITEKNNGNDISVTDFWVDPILPRDENGIDVYEGKKDMGEDDDVEDLTEAEETELLIGFLEQRRGEMVNEQ